VKDDREAEMQPVEVELIHHKPLLSARPAGEPTIWP
jgi:hypothetical protein